MAVVANRVREDTRVYHALEAFLKALKIPFVTTLRDSQNYIRAVDQGLGVLELAQSAVEKDMEQWKPLVSWLKSNEGSTASGLLAVALCSASSIPVALLE